MVRVHSIGVLSAAKLCGVVQGVIGAIVGIIILFAGMLGSAIAPFGSRMGFAGSVAAAIAITLCYAVVGFVAGGIGAFVYNWAAEAMGGLELELVSVSPAPAPSPSSYSAGA